MGQDNLIFNFESKGFGNFVTKAILGFFILIFSIIGIVLFLVSLSPLLFGQFEPKYFLMLSISITAFFFCLLIGNQLKKGVSVKEIIVNFEKECFQVLENTGRIAEISFREVQKFSLKIESSGSSSSSGRNTNFYYVVFLHKKDGSMIALNWFNDKGHGNLLLDELNQKVKITEGLNPEEDEELDIPEGIRFEKIDDGKFVMQWKSKIGKFENIIGYGSVISFLTTFTSGVFLADPGMIMISIFLVFISFFVGITLYYLFKAIAIKGYLLQLNGSSIEYFYQTRTGPKKVKTVPLAEFFGTQVNIDRNKFTDPNREIWVVREEENQKIQSLLHADLDPSQIFASLGELFKLKMQIMNLEFPGYSIVDLFKIEKLIDRELSGSGSNRF